MIKTLLVEDEVELAHWLVKALARYEHFVVDWVADGLLADRRLEHEEFDVVALDLGLPGMDGATVLARMRARGDRTPVIVLTARDCLAQSVGMLHDGADDFLPKPFQLAELEARLQALVRRSRGRQFERMACADLLYDLSGQRFSVAGEPLALTPREHAVMKVLIQKSGEPVAKQAILDRIEPEKSQLGLDAIEVIVHRLRKKILTSQAHIVTVRGVGYCLEGQT